MLHVSNTMELYFPIKKNEIMSFDWKWTQFGDYHIKQNNPGSEKQKYWYLLLFVDPWFHIYTHAHTHTRRKKEYKMKLEGSLWKMRKERKRIIKERKKQDGMS